MFKLSTALIFVNFLTIIYAPDPSNRTIPDLVEINSEQALPLVLFEAITEIESEYPISRGVSVSSSVVTEGGRSRQIHELSITTMFAKMALQLGELEVPDDVVRPEVVDGRLVKGTEFFSKSSRNQIFFCPKVEDEARCLVPQGFQQSQQLKCPTEAIPDVHLEVRQGRCGSNDSGILYSIGYEICPKEPPYKYITPRMEFYIICYFDDTESHTESTLFTQHYIMSPNLLKSDTLAREREVTYPYADSKFKPSIFEDPFNPDLESLVHPKKPAYKVRKLVPDEDMAFALWRKTTYKNYNVNWQHKELIALWDKINQYIRSNAIEMSNGNDKIETLINTSVLEIASEFEDDQMSNIWVKAIRIMPKTLLDITRVRVQGIAILMNNFLDVKTSDSTSAASTNQRETAIEKYCGESLCTKALQDEFRNVGGRVRCCPITEDVGLLFDSGSTSYSPPLLEIPGINV